MENLKHIPGWIDSVKDRGAGPFALTLLEALEPLAPVIAQGLWMAQPVAGLWNGRDATRELAELLEGPEGLAYLRRRLVEDEG